VETFPNERARALLWAVCVVQSCEFNSSTQSRSKDEADRQQFHPEKLQSAITRYENEIGRVWSVIELHLGKTGKPYLIGDKMSFVDLMFISWNRVVSGLMGEQTIEEYRKKYPLTFEWNKKLQARDTVKEAERLGEEMGGH
jgi:glutathione S-transferase